MEFEILERDDEMDVKPHFWPQDWISKNGLVRILRLLVSA